MVYRAYLRISKLDPPALSIIERAAVIQKAIVEIVKLWAKQTINNTAGLDGLVPTLLVYGAYLKINKLDPPALSIMEQAAVI